MVRMRLRTDDSFVYCTDTYSLLHGCDRERKIPVMADWIDELFDCGPENDYSNVYYNSRRFAASLCRTSTLLKEEQDDLIDELLDFEIEMTSDEIQERIVKLQLNQKASMEFYAPSQRDITNHIKNITTDE